MSERNTQRASFLKSRRQRLTPEQVGLPRTARRRVTTLRREDVAWLADVGITWYTWLEQGRPIKIAAETLDRIAAALRLDMSETEYLRKLVHPQEHSRPHWATPVVEGVRRLVESYTAGYAFVIGPRWDLMAWNAAGAVLMGLDRTVEGVDASLSRNALWYMFAGPQARATFPQWDALARRMVATLRCQYADYVGDSGFASLIDALLAHSAEFAAMWADVDVLSPTRWTVGEIRDPRTGLAATFETVSLCIPESPGQTLRFVVPAATRVPLAALAPLA